jgi:hypothetical protein
MDCIGIAPDASPDIEIKTRNTGARASNPNNENPPGCHVFCTTVIVFIPDFPSATLLTV